MGSLPAVERDCIDEQLDCVARDGRHSLAGENLETCQHRNHYLEGWS